MAHVLPESPAVNLDAYLDCDEWQLFAQVHRWVTSDDPRRQRLGREWKKLHLREVKWKMSFSAELSVDELQKGTRFASAADYEAQIRSHLPRPLKQMPLRVDLATQDPRPLKPHGRDGKADQYL
jgi:hypothetical protein